MKRYLDQLRKLQRKYDHCPIIYAGDIFDKWNSPPELINFAIRHLPEGFSIPGQHDLPCHAYEDVHKSAYHTLVEAGILRDLKPGKPAEVSNRLILFPFPWGHEVTPLKNKDYQDGKIHLAVVHAYCWVPGKAYPGAVEKDNAHSSGWGVRLAGYDAAVFGDNHKGFLTDKNGTVIFNHGAFMPVKADERNYVPQVGLLLVNGTVKLHPLDVSQDQWLPVENMVKVAESTGASMDDLFELLRAFGDAALDFEEAVKRYCKKAGVPKRVSKLLDLVMEEADG